MSLGWSLRRCWVFAEGIASCSRSRESWQAKGERASSRTRSRSGNNGCPVPQDGTGRYKFNVIDARLKRRRPLQIQKQRRSPSADIGDTAGSGCGIWYSVRAPCWSFCHLTFERQLCPISSECPRSRYLCSFPVAVRGNSFTNRYSCGHLKLGKRVRSQP